MLKLWLGLLLGFFAFGVADDKGADADAGADAGADGGEDKGDAGEQGDLNLDLDAGADAGDGDDAGEDKGDDAAAQLAAEKAARTAAEERAEAHQRELNELRAAQRPAPRSEDERIFEAEEARLKDPKITDLEKWQINSNRTIRATKNSSQAALLQAQDLADRTAFRQLEVTKPGLFKRYEKRVEDELAKVRKAGGNTTREGILRYLIGSDAMEGKLASKKKDDGDKGVVRGKLPGARSDVRGKGGLSEAEKREARLENVRL